MHRWLVLTKPQTFEVLTPNLPSRTPIQQTTESDILTNELIGFVQPRKQLLTVAVIDGNAHEVVVADEVRFGTGVAGIQDICDSILSHQFLLKDGHFA